MPFSVDEICRLATVMPGDLIIYKLNQNHSGRILYYSKGMPDFVGVTPEVYAAGVSVDIPLQPEVGEEIVINQGIGDWKLSPVEENRTYRMQHPKKGDVWFRAHTKKVGEVDGAPVMFSTLTDISSETLAYRQFLDRSGDLSVIFSEKNYDIYFASDAFASFLDLPVHEILKKKIYEVFGCKDWIEFEQLMQNAGAEENSYFDEKSGRSFITEMFSVTWEEYHARALLLHDMTSAVERQKSAEKLYRDRMNFLMSSNENAVYALYIDMTESKIISGRCLQYKLSINEKGGVRKWLEECIFPHFPFPDDQEKFMKNFEREHLLKCFSEGQTQVEFEYFLYKGEQICRYNLSVDMFQNPVTAHVECYVLGRDITMKYVDRIIDRVLFYDDYKAIGVIDVDRNILFLRSNLWKNVGFEAEKEQDYSAAVKKLKEARVYTEDQEMFERYASMQNIIDKLEGTNQYFFTVHNKKQEVERYAYFWMNKKERIILFVNEDMTKEMETDPLTGAPNRKGFYRLASKVLAENKDRNYAVLFFNIRRFKAINDLFGYETGDRVIREAVINMQNCPLKPVVLARTEADHFAALVDVENLDLSKLPDILHTTLVRGNIKTDIYGRCGIYYVSDQDTSSISEMCDMAKLAKAYITNEYVQPYAVFNESMRKDYSGKSVSLVNLDSALQKNEFKVYYQPIYDAKTGKIASAEALIRWNSPQYGMILPGTFIPPLEDSGHISKLDMFVNRSVHDFIEKRDKAGKLVVPVSVNLSRMDLMDSHMIGSISQEIEDSQLPRTVFRYELTESAYAEIGLNGQKFLSGLRADGVKILVDDFGSGLSSFSTIRDYDFDILKLDMGFVRKIDSSSKANNIIISIIDLAKRLDMKVIAEGVETKEHADFLRTHGCDYFQGYYFAKPLPQAEFEKLLDAQQRKNGDHFGESFG